MAQDQYVYNIGAVERMTGIPAATLRAWERRYDFPHTERTKGRHRLYSDRHIARLRWVKNKIDQGVQTKHAIEMLHQREIVELEEIETGPLTTEPAAVGINLQDLAQQLMTVLAAGNLVQAEALFQHELALYPPEKLVLQVLLPVLVEIGQRWEAGELSVSDEHLATHFLRHRIVMWLHTAPPPFNRPPIVLACAPGELHEGALLAMGTLLRRRRWPIAYLGQSVPLDDLAQFVAHTTPLAIVLSATCEQSAQALAHWPETMPKIAARGKPLLGYGGRIFVEQPEWRVRVPGIYLGDTIQDGMNTLEQYLGQ